MSRPNDRAELRIDGAVYSGWTGVDISLGIEQQTATFSLSYTGNIRGGAVPIPPLAACEVWLGDELAIRGHVDSVTDSGNSESHTVAADGRDAVADLADCSVATSQNEFVNLTVPQVVRALCRPFGIEVVDAANLRERVPLFTINQGETVLVNILRICRLLSAYPVALGDGRLTLARPGSERVTGEPIQLGGEGSSVLAWSYGKSFLERFSIVDVRGQSQDYDPFTRSLIRPRGRATDAAVTRYRPLVIISDVPGAEGDFSQRARQEVAWRRGDSERISYTMQGWRQPGTGLIWRPGMTVAVLDSINDIQGERLVSSVNLSRNEGGTFTELTLVALDTYQVPR